MSKLIIVAKVRVLCFECSFLYRGVGATLKAGTAEWPNGGMAENDPKS